MRLCVPISIYNCNLAFNVNLVCIDVLECHIWMKVFHLNVIKIILWLKKTFLSLYSYVRFLRCLHCLQHSFFEHLFNLYFYVDETI